MLKIIKLVGNVWNAVMEELLHIGKELHGINATIHDISEPFLSCLIMGKNFSGEPIHSVWAYNPKNQWAVLITVYRPDPERWVDWKFRVKK